MKIKTNGNLWLCGQIRGRGWEFQGVFTSRRKAEDACKSVNYFICPIVLNKECPDEAVDFEGVEYPHLDCIGLNLSEVNYISVKPGTE